MLNTFLAYEYKTAKVCAMPIPNESPPQIEPPGWPVRWTPIETKAISFSKSAEQCIVGYA